MLLQHSHSLSAPLLPGLPSTLLCGGQLPADGGEEGVERCEGLVNIEGVVDHKDHVVAQCGRGLFDLVGHLHVSGLGLPEPTTGPPNSCLYFAATRFTVWAIREPGSLVRDQCALRW